MPLKWKFSSTNGVDRLGAARVNQVPAQVDLPVGQRLGGNHLPHFLEKGRGGDIHIALARQADGGEIILPREARGPASSDRLAACGDRRSWARAAPPRVCDALASCVSRSITVWASVAAVAAGSPISSNILADVLLVLGALLLGFGVVARVVIAVRQAQAALVHFARHLGAVLEVLRGIHPEECVDSDALEVRNLGLQAGTSAICSMRSSSGCNGFRPSRSIAAVSMQVP